MEVDNGRAVQSNQPVDSSQSQTFPSNLLSAQDVTDASMADEISSATETFDPITNPSTHQMLSTESSLQPLSPISSVCFDLIKRFEKYK